MLADRVQEFLGGPDVHEGVEVARVEGDVVQDEAPAVHDGHDVGEGLDRRDDDGDHGLGQEKRTTRGKRTSTRQRSSVTRGSSSARTFKKKY